MTCKECLYYSAFCSRDGFGGDAIADNCDRFKDKSRFVELPCKVGDTVYQTDGVRIYESRINKIIYDTTSIAFDESAIGESIFLTKEEAERILEESKYIKDLKTMTSEERERHYLGKWGKERQMSRFVRYTCNKKNEPKMREDCVKCPEYNPCAENGQWCFVGALYAEYENTKACDDMIVPISADMVNPVMRDMQEDFLKNIEEKMYKSFMCQFGKEQ